MIPFDNRIKINALNAFLNAFKAKKEKANWDNSRERECIMRWNIGVKQNWTSDKGAYNGSWNQGSTKPIDRGPNCN